MSEPLTVTGVRFSAAPPELLESGLLGWTTFLLNGRLRVDAVAVRRTLDGDLVLSFPKRQDRRGREHALVAPVDDATRLEIESQVLRAIGLEKAAAR